MYTEKDVLLINEILLHRRDTDNTNTCIKACISLLESLYVRTPYNPDGGVRASSTQDLPPATKIRAYVPIEQETGAAPSSSRRSRSVTAQSTEYN